MRNGECLLIFPFARKNEGERVIFGGIVVTRHMASDNGQAGLFPDFADGSLRRRLIGLSPTAGEFPVQTSIGVLDKEHLTFLIHNKSRRADTFVDEEGKVLLVKH